MSVGIARRQTASARAASGASSLFTRLALISPLLLFADLSGASAAVYNFSYVGIGDPNVWGRGTFTTGPAYPDGYMPVTSISGVTEAGIITVLVTSGGAATDPGTGDYLYCCAFDYDNSFSPSGLAGGNPFSSTGGPLFTVSVAIDSPINLFGDGNANTYEFSYGEDTADFNAASFGGTPIDFVAAIQSAPEPDFFGALAAGLAGMLFAAWRRPTSKPGKS